MGVKKNKLPKAISDLKHAAYNAKLRQISAGALGGLQHSLERHGDLSGITFNLNTGNLVSGHQRLEALKARYGADNLRLEPTPIDGQGIIYAPDGNTFAVRYVTFSEAQEKAANLAANSADIAGEFLWDGVEAQLGDLNGLDIDLSDTGFSRQTMDDLLFQQIGSPDNPATPRYQQSLQLAPAQEYLIILAKNGEEWDRMIEYFQLKKVRRGGYKEGSAFDAVGIERVLPFERVLNAHSNTE